MSAQIITEVMYVVYCHECSSELGEFINEPDAQACVDEHNEGSHK